MPALSLTPAVQSPSGKRTMVQFVGTGHRQRVRRRCRLYGSVVEQALMASFRRTWQFGQCDRPVGRAVFAGAV
jgi:hypothetical protein